MFSKNHFSTYATSLFLVSYFITSGFIFISPFPVLFWFKCGSPLPKFLKQSLHSFEFFILNNKGVGVTFPSPSPVLCFSGYSVRYLGLTLPHSLRGPSWQVLLPGPKHMTKKCVLSEQITLFHPGTYCENLCFLRGPTIHQNTWSSHHVLALC